MKLKLIFTKLFIVLKLRMVCCYCFRTGHNSRTCTKKAGDIKRQKEMIPIKVVVIEQFDKSLCSICYKSGHDKRTCPEDDKLKQETYVNITCSESSEIFQKKLVIQKIEGYIEGQSYRSLLEIMKKLNIQPLD